MDEVVYRFDGIKGPMPFRLVSIPSFSLLFLIEEWKKEKEQVRLGWPIELSYVNLAGLTQMVNLLEKGWAYRINVTCQAMHA